MSARFQHFNDLPAGQYEALKKDIEARGLVLPILVDEDDKTIDGHMRRRACGELHIDCPRIVVSDLSEDEKHSLAIALNLFRRQLSGVERSKAIGEMSRLGLSNRRIAEAIGTSESTVRRDLKKSGAADDAPDATVPGGTPKPPPGVDPETGEIAGAGESNPAEKGSPKANGSPAPRKVTGKDGKSYPAKKPAVAVKDVDPAAGYRATASRFMKQTSEGVLTLTPARWVEVTQPEDRPALAGFAKSLRSCADAIDAELAKSKTLKAV